jgi:hypothetical protein
MPRLSPNAATPFFAPPSTSFELDPDVAGVLRNVEEVNAEFREALRRRGLGADG